MTRRIPNCLAGLAALWVAQVAGFGHYSPGQVVQARRAVQAELAGAATEPRLAAQLMLAHALAPTDALAQELRLHRVLLVLRDFEPQARTRAEVESLTSYVPQAWTDPDDPDHGRGRAAPVADIAAAARGTLRHWQLRERIAAYGHALAQARELAAPVDGEALALALARVPAALLPSVQAQVRDWPATALAALARRSASVEDYRRLFHAVAQPASYAALREVARALPPHEAAAVLIEAAARNPELASAAVLALEPLAGQRGVRDFLLAQLADARLGGSAAQVLALHADAVTRTELERLLDLGHDSLALRRALLVLQRIGDAAALARLRVFTADPRYGRELRERIGRGLP